MQLFSPQTVTSTGKGVAPAAAAAPTIPVHHPEHNEAPNEVLNVHRGAAGDGETGHKGFCRPRRADDGHAELCP